MAFVCLSEFFGEFRKISDILEATTAKQMKIDPYCQRSNPMNVLFNFVLAVDFFASRRPSYKRCCHALTLALARLSCTCLVCIRYGPLNCLGLP